MRTKSARVGERGDRATSRARVRMTTNVLSIVFSFYEGKRLVVSRAISFFRPPRPPAFFRRPVLPFVYRASATSSRTRSSTFAFALVHASGVYGGGTTQHPITVSVAAR